MSLATSNSCVTLLLCRPGQKDQPLPGGHAEGFGETFLGLFEKYTQTLRRTLCRPTLPTQLLRTVSLACWSRTPSWPAMPAAPGTPQIGAEVKLGLLTVAFPDQSLDEVAEWASRKRDIDARGSLPAPRRGRRPTVQRGMSYRRNRPQREQGQGHRGQAGRLRGRHQCPGYYPNPLHPDPETKDQALEHIRAVIKGASLLQVPVVNTFIGNDRHATPKENFRQFQKTWPDVVRFARDHGVKIAIENCPMLFSEDEWPGGHNLAFSPAVWRAMFEAIGDDTLGLNLDPSHLLWQMIDMERVVDEFGSRIYHVHAKDMEIDRDGLYNYGIMRSALAGNARGCRGCGARSDFPRFISALYRTVTTMSCAWSTKTAVSRARSSWSRAVSCWLATSWSRG